MDFVKLLTKVTLKVKFKLTKYENSASIPIYSTRISLKLVKNAYLGQVG